MNFNSHAHVERDDYCFFNTGLEMNFNSHAHVERDRTPKKSLRSTAISTHTLTWSVTLCPGSRKHFHLHFNSHAHVERDCGIFILWGRYYEFQLTRSRGA